MSGEPNDAGTTSPTAVAGRVDAFDFVKGVLVFFMVVYHALNHSAHFELGYRWLAFLPPSFVIITGFLLAHVYFNRPPERDGGTRWRLAARGLKLLLVFTVLNLMANLVASRNWNGAPMGVRYFFENWFDIYVRADGQMAAFEVLLSLSYLLLLGPILLWLARQRRSWLTVVCVLGAAACVWLERTGWMTGAAALVGAGLLGVIVGRSAAPVFNCLQRWWWAAMFGYAFNTVVMRRVGDSFPLQLTGAFLALAVLYGIGTRWDLRTWRTEWLLTLGRYSLPAYIVQIGALQVLARWFPRPEFVSVRWVILFGSAAALTILSVVVLDRLRRRSEWVDKCYRWGFA